jgi:hypothetical protein
MALQPFYGLEFSWVLLCMIRFRHFIANNALTVHSGEPFSSLSLRIVSSQDGWSTFMTQASGASFSVFIPYTFIMCEVMPQNTCAQVAPPKAAQFAK